MMNPIPVVLANFRKHLAGMLGSLFLLAVAFSGTLIMSLTERGIKDAGADAARESDLIMGAPGDQTSLVLSGIYLWGDKVLPLVDISLLETLRHDAAVAAAGGLVMADHYKGFPIVGMDESFQEVMPQLRLESGSWPTQDFEVVAGPLTTLDVGATFLGSHGVAEQAASRQHSEHAYRVVGRLAASGGPWDKALLCRYTSIWALHEAGGGATKKVSCILVKPKTFGAAYQLKVRYTNKDSVAVFPAEVLGQLYGVLGNVKAVVQLFTLLFQILISLAVMINLVSQLSARMPTISLLRAVGASRSYVFLALWVEFFLLFLVAVIVSLPLAAVAYGVIAEYLHSLSAMVMRVSFAAEDLAYLGFLVLLGLAASLVPALLSYRSSPRDGLRPR